MKNKKALRKITCSFVLFFFLLILYVQSGLERLFIFVSALLIHEVSHFLIMRLFKIQLEDFEILPFGAKITAFTENLSPIKKAFLYFSGVFSNILLCLLITFFSYYVPIRNADFIVFYNLLIALINLIPILPLDASKILFAFLKTKTSKTQAFEIVYIISLIIDLVIFVIGLYIFFFKSQNLLLLLLALFFIIHIRREREAFDFSLFKEIARKVG